MGYRDLWRADIIQPTTYEIMSTSGKQYGIYFRQANIEIKHMHFDIKKI